jgi:adenosylcobinamide kinase / adenosylcobinamide-phosphate guanylyltransferase
MHFIFGGRRMGKLEYAKSLTVNPVICDLSFDEPETMFKADIINNVHLLVKDILRSGGNPTAYFEQHLVAFQDKIVIGDEVGCGIVPMEPSEREWRDETGRVYQLLAAHAREVTHMWAGLPQALKREGQ